MRSDHVSRWSIDPPCDYDVGECPDCHGIGCDVLQSIVEQYERTDALQAMREGC